MAHIYSSHYISEVDPIDHPGKGIKGEEGTEWQRTDRLFETLGL